VIELVGLRLERAESVMRGRGFNAKGSCERDAAASMAQFVQHGVYTSVKSVTIRKIGKVDDEEGGYAKVDGR